MRVPAEGFGNTVNAHSSVSGYADSAYSTHEAVSRDEGDRCTHAYRRLTRCQCTWEHDERLLGRTLSAAERGEDEQAHHAH
ncbi:MAG: hypothetical protein ACKOB6_04860, partial [Candidatus Kapaibacterium sp.]